MAKKTKKIFTPKKNIKLVGLVVLLAGVIAGTITVQYYHLYTGPKAMRITGGGTYNINHPTESSSVVEQEEGRISEQEEGRRTGLSSVVKSVVEQEEGRISEQEEGRISEQEEGRRTGLSSVVKSVIDQIVNEEDGDSDGKKEAGNSSGKLEYCTYEDIKDTEGKVIYPKNYCFCTTDNCYYHMHNKDSGGWETLHCKNNIECRSQIYERIKKLEGKDINENIKILDMKNTNKENADKGNTNNSIFPSPVYVSDHPTQNYPQATDTSSGWATKFLQWVFRSR